MVEDLFEHASREATEAGGPARGAYAAASPRRVCRSAPPVVARLFAPRLDRARCPVVGDPLGTAWVRQDDLGAARGRCHQPAFRPAQRGHLRRARYPRRHRQSSRGAGVPAAPHRPVHRRDSPVQQSPTGCAPASRRRRHDRLVGRDHRKSIHQRHCAPAVASSGAAARAAHTRRPAPDRPAGRYECEPRPRHVGTRLRARGDQGDRRGGLPATPARR